MNGNIQPDQIKVHVSRDSYFQDMMLPVAQLNSN